MKKFITIISLSLISMCAFGQDIRKPFAKLDSLSSKVMSYMPYFFFLFAAILVIQFIRLRNRDSNNAPLVLIAAFLALFMGIGAIWVQ